jgi:hypothetical protein
LSSRGTTHVTPFGIDFFAREGNKKSQYIYSWYKKKARLDVNLRCDEKYLNYFYFNSIVFTYELQKNNLSKNSLLDQANIFSEKLTEKSSTNLFKESGIFIYRDKKITIFVGIKNSGAIYLYSGDQLKLIHGGISFFEGKNIFTSTFIDPNSNVSFKKDKNYIELNVKSRFARYADRIILDKYGFLVHIFSHFVLKVPFIKKVTVPIKRYLVSRRVFCNYYLSRKIRISNFQVKITDNLVLDESKVSKIKLIVHKASHLIYSPSSRMSDSIYFENDLLLDLNVIDKKVSYITTFVMP